MATLTIAMAVPTIVFSLWGTNVPLPFQEDPEGFYEVIGVPVGEAVRTNTMRIRTVR